MYCRVWEARRENGGKGGRRKGVGGIEKKGRR